LFDVTASNDTARPLIPLYLAGFTSAFGAHGVASVLGAESADLGLTLLGLGAVLALYDLAEVVLKPVFGALSDRIGAKPVIIGGLIAFAAALLSASPAMLALARLGQGAAASAFSPASSAAVARLAGKERLGRYFGRYGAWKSLGYVLGPPIGIALTGWFGIQSLYLTLALFALAATAWVSRGLPTLPPAPRQRSTLKDLMRQTTTRGFLLPTLLMAMTTGILGVAVGFLPLLAVRLELHPLTGAAAVALLALTSTAVQPVIGRLHDEGRLRTSTGSAIGMALAAGGLALLALWPNVVTLFTATLAFGTMAGTLTPLAFAHLAATTPEDRMGRTMGSAEMGRELGDAGGPLLVGALATVWTLPAALLTLAGLSAVAGAAGWSGLRRDDDGARRA